MEEKISLEEFEEKFSELSFWHKNGFMLGIVGLLVFGLLATHFLSF